jgi:hypothetical protein
MTDVGAPTGLRHTQSSAGRLSDHLTIWIFTAAEEDWLVQVLKSFVDGVNFRVPQGQREVGFAAHSY